MRLVIWVLLVLLVVRLAGAEPAWEASNPLRPAPAVIPTSRFPPELELEQLLIDAERRITKWEALQSDLVAGRGQPWVPDLERALRAYRAAAARDRRWRPYTADLTRILAAARAGRPAPVAARLVDGLAGISRLRAGWLRRAIAEPSNRLQGELRLRAGLEPDYVPDTSTLRGR